MIISFFTKIGLRGRKASPAGMYAPLYLNNSLIFSDDNNALPQFDVTVGGQLASLLMGLNVMNKSPIFSWAESFSR